MNDNKMNEVIDDVSKEIDHELRKFGETFKEGLSNPEHMMSIDEIERALRSVQNCTNQLYSEMTGRILDKVEESKVIRLKKANTEPKE